MWPLDVVGQGLLRYWNWAGSNIGAMPACGLLALAIGAPITYLLRDRIGHALKGWWQRHLGHAAELAELREIASKAQRIAADTYRHHTGRDHPDAPSSPRAERGVDDR
jgi:hypothetical protein